MRRVDHSYVFGDRRIDPARDWREYVRQLGEQFPADAAAIAALFDEIRAIFDGMVATARRPAASPVCPIPLTRFSLFPSGIRLWSCGWSGHSKTWSPATR